MAHTTGTATNYLDLLDKLRTFVTTDSELVAAGQAWAQLRWDNDELILRGPGLDGSQEIYVGLRGLSLPSQDIYSFGILGAMAYTASFAFTAQPGTSPECYVPLWNDAIPYRIVANGQRIVLVAKISTRYVACYLGYGLPWALPGDYPAPLYVGGCSASLTERWSSNDYGFRSFADPGNGAQLLLPSGAWKQVRNYYANGSSEYEDDTSLNVWPYAGLRGKTGTVLKTLRNNGDGSYTPFPLVLHGSSPSPEIYMELDGCYYVSGFGNGAETIVMIDGVDHIVVPNIFRSDRWGYWLLRLA